jgi:addiction module HigA family antidote
MPITFAPSVFIQEEMNERGWSIETLAEKSLLSKSLLEEVLNNRRTVTRIIALGLSNAFGTGEEIWINLQKSFDEGLREADY